MADNMTIPMVHWFLDRFEQAGATVWLDGGWGVDALVGRQTRTHDDIDIMVPESDSARLVQVLRAHGFEDVPTDDETPENFVMGHPDHGRIDFHIFRQMPDGSGVYKPGSGDHRITVGEFNAEGSVGGRKVRCFTPEYQVRSHHGYRLAETDIHDLALLSATFRVELLDDQADLIERCPFSSS